MRPLILDYKTIRINPEVESVFEYDPYEGMNMIVVNNITKPFIESTTAEVLLLTRTRVKTEMDDNSSLIELLTKTKVKNEQDDLTIDHIELSTKTLVKTENDDVRTSHY